MIDFALSADGDLIYNNDTNDLYIVTEDSMRYQKVLCVIKSIKKDWFVDNIGSDLEECYGMALNDNTIAVIKNKIITGCKDIINVDELYIEAFIDEIYKVIIFKVYVQSMVDKSKSYKIECELDLVKGINVKV